MPGSETVSETYTIADIQTTFRRFRADILMIAESTKAITRNEAEEYAHDAEYLATRGYLKKVDVTLLNGTAELHACVYTINEDAGGLATSRPGGVLWPKVADPALRIVLSYTKEYTPEKRALAAKDLKIGWVRSDADTSHQSLKSTGARDFVSNGFGLQRKDLG